METKLLVKSCRICYKEFSRGVNLFGEESRRLFLHAKIRKYLSLTISSEDRLPKMICNDCCSKIDGFHEFATMALRNQEKMAKLILCNSNRIEQIQTENKSLLHTYLTKGIKEKEEQESEITEMEVKVDPMIILQCCLDEDEENSVYNGEIETIEDKPEEIPNKDTVYIAVETISRDVNSDERRLHICSMCPKKFTSDISLQSHMWTHASYPKRILNTYNMIEPKPQLQLQFVEEKQSSEPANSSSDEKDEDEDVDSEDLEHDHDYLSKKVNCPICGKVISTKGNLKVHLETHRPKGRYGCDICGRIFKTQCNLFRHKEYHGGVQYPCGVCGRVYPTNSTLRAHSITHSDLRPHECPMCDKTFKRNQDLKFHINQHTGARPYQCPYCPKAFASSGNCFSHRKRMHPVEVERDREKAAKIMR